MASFEFTAFRVTTSSLENSATPGLPFPLFLQVQEAVPVRFTDGDGDPQLDSIDPEGNQEVSIDGAASLPVGDFSYYTLETSGGETLTFIAFLYPLNSGSTYLVPYDPSTEELLHLTGDQINAFVGVDADAELVTATPADDNVLMCFTTGALISTPEGERAVETLNVGDLVLTLDGDPQPIRWIGMRRLSPAELRMQPDLLPVQIAAGALGNGLPQRDLLVSPQHRILLRDWRAELMFGEQEVLAPAKALINGTSIRLKTAETIEYYHLLFDRHEIVFAEGLPTESFFPGDYVLDEMSAATHAELLTLFPELRGGAGAYGKMARPCLKPWEAAALTSSAQGEGVTGP